MMGEVAMIEVKYVLWVAGGYLAGRIVGILFMWWWRS
jgi:hypothetical protein